MQSIAISTQPASEPITTFEAKTYLRIDSNDDDALIAELITAARELAELYTRRKFINTGITLTLDGFPYNDVKWWDGVRQGRRADILGQADKIVLPFSPASTVTSITTYNDANTSAVFDSGSYRLDTAGYIYLNDGYTWPVDLRNHAAVEIIYTAGYGASASSVPTAIKHAIKIAVSAMYEDRTCFELPATAKSALMPYRVLEERRNGCM